MLKAIIAAIMDNNIKEKIESFEKGIKIREREIKNHQETIEHFKNIINELKKQIDGQGELF